MKKSGITNIYNISFGATSAVMTSLALVISLSGLANKTALITSLLVIAIADNISDSFGIHIYQESKNIDPQEVKETTTSNFIARMLITAVFILFVLCLPVYLTIILSILFGITIMILLSYFIARNQQINPYGTVFRHLLLAIILMVASFILKYVILKM